MRSLHYSKKFSTKGTSNVTNYSSIFEIMHPKATVLSDIFLAISYGFHSGFTTYRLIYIYS